MKVENGELVIQVEPIKRAEPSENFSMSTLVCKLLQRLLRFY